MSKPTYEELEALINRIYKTTRVESVLGNEWANYPVEVFDEVIEFATITMRELNNELEPVEGVKPEAARTGWAKWPQDNE